MRDYPILHLDTQIKVKEHHFYCCSTFHSHNGIFNYDNSYPKMSVKQPAVERYSLRLTIKVISLLFWCYLVHRIFLEVQVIIKKTFSLHT